MEGEDRNPLVSGQQYISLYYNTNCGQANSNDLPKTDDSSSTKPREPAQPEKDSPVTFVTTSGSSKNVEPDLHGPCSGSTITNDSQSKSDDEDDRAALDLGLRMSLGLHNEDPDAMATFRVPRSASVASARKGTVKMSTPAKGPPMMQASTPIIWAVSTHS